jgi:hypothetical protein
MKLRSKRGQRQAVQLQQQEKPAPLAEEHEAETEETETEEVVEGDEEVSGDIATGSGGGEGESAAERRARSWGGKGDSSYRAMTLGGAQPVGLRRGVGLASHAGSAAAAGRSAGLTVAAGLGGGTGLLPAQRAAQLEAAEMDAVLSRASSVSGWSEHPGSEDGAWSVYCCMHGALLPPNWRRGPFPFAPVLASERSRWWGQDV